MRRDSALPVKWTLFVYNPSVYRLHVHLQASLKAASSLSEFKYFKGSSFEILD